MSVEIRTKGGKLIGKLSDDMDGDEFLMVDNKKVPIGEVYQNKELKDSFNESVKNENKDDTDGSKHSK